MASAFRGLGRRLRADERVAPRGREALARTQRALANGELQAALEGFRRELRSRPEGARLRLKVAQLYERLGAPKRAVEAYMQAAERFAVDAHERQAASVLSQVIRSTPRFRCVTSSLRCCSHADKSLGSDRRWQPARSEQFAWLLKHFTEVIPK